MRRITTLLVATVFFMGSLFGSQMTVRAEETQKEETLSASELCKSAKSWEEYKAIFEEFQYEREDYVGRILKGLPETIESLSSFKEAGYCIADEQANELKEAVEHAVSLYNQQGYLTLYVERRDFKGSYSDIRIRTKRRNVTHLGNVVGSVKVPYYKNVSDYKEQKDAMYYEKQVLCYTCGVAYWKEDGTLEKVDYVPLEKLATLKDEEKKQVDTNFEGTILVLLCTTDKVLGWANIENLYQYEDALGNMEFYNPEYIQYYQEN